MALILSWALTRPRGPDLPWTPLDLGEQPGRFTGRKLAGLGSDPRRCQQLLRRAGIRFEQIADRREGPSCGYAGAVRLRPGGARTIALDPRGPVMSCPVAAAMAMWEWSVVQPAALHYLGSNVRGIEHYGTYNCRPIAGSKTWSEHATANALDVAAFRLADGRRIGVTGDWRGHGPAATFLRKTRTGACDLFATVLSPDYNASHRDHLHLDQAARGAWGWRACR